MEEVEVGAVCLPTFLSCFFNSFYGFFSKVITGFRKFWYELVGVGGDIWRWHCKHVHRQLFAHINGGLRGGYSVSKLGGWGPPSVWTKILKCYFYKNSGQNEPFRPTQRNIYISRPWRISDCNLYIYLPNYLSMIDFLQLVL